MRFSGRDNRLAVDELIRSNDRVLTDHKRTLRGALRFFAGHNSVRSHKEVRLMDKLRISLCAASLILSMAVPVLGQNDEPPPDLTDAERNRAIALAKAEIEEHLTIEGDSRIALVSAELLPQKDDEPRAALMSYYRYADDAALLITIDLESNLVIRARVRPENVLPLGDEENEQARKLALETEELKRLIGDSIDKVQVNSLVIRPQREQEGFGHRIAHLFFLIDGEPLDRMAIVDLTINKVKVAPLEEPSDDDDH